MDEVIPSGKDNGAPPVLRELTRRADRTWLSQFSKLIQMFWFGRPPVTRPFLHLSAANVSSALLTSYRDLCGGMTA